MRIDITSAQLFGNEAGEDEDEVIFQSYAIRRPELANFLAQDVPISIVRAYKGEGKSALLRLVYLDLVAQNPAPVVLQVSANSISPEIDGVESDRWVRGWKANILKQAAREIGKRIHLAFRDDAIALVEEAEASGFRSRNFVSSIADRLKTSAVPLERNRPPTANHQALLERYLAGGDFVWMMIDDIDQNFENTPINRVKIASFFTAVRQISIAIPEFRFRIAVRPNIWTIVKREYEAMSHVEQYVTDLIWSFEDFETMISKRVEGYLRRTGQWTEFTRKLAKGWEIRPRELIKLVFEDPMPWGMDRSRPPAVTLLTLARHRPRWLVELWRVSAKAAKSKNSEVIELTHINTTLEAFGKRRIDDTVAEFKSQCPNVEDLLVAFVGESDSFKTADLLEIVQRKILKGNTSLRIFSVIGIPSARETAHFLYQIGFLTARLDHANGSYTHLAFSQNPSLLKSGTNVDQGHSWEVHPVFRYALRLKTH